MATMIGGNGGGSGGGMQVKMMTDSSLGTDLYSYAENYRYVDCGDNDVDIFTVPIKKRKRLLHKAGGGSTWYYALVDLDEEKALRRTVTQSDWRGWPLVKVENNTLHVADVWIQQQASNNTIRVLQEDGTTKGPFVLNPPSGLNIVAGSNTYMAKYYDPVSDILYMVIPWSSSQTNATPALSVYTLTNIFSSATSVLTKLQNITLTGLTQSYSYQTYLDVVGEYKRNGKICFWFHVACPSSTTTYRYGNGVSIDTSTNTVVYNYNNSSSNELKQLLWGGSNTEISTISGSYATNRLDVYKGRQVVSQYLIDNIRGSLMTLVIPVYSIKTEPTTGVAYGFTMGSKKDAIFFNDKPPVDYIERRDAVSGSNLNGFLFFSANEVWMLGDAFNLRLTSSPKPVKS